jgi:hypothetical protein
VNWNDVVNNIKATRHFLLTIFNILNFTIKFKEDTEYITDKGRQKASVMTQDICLFTGVRKN